MSIATRPGARRSPHVRRAGAAASRLDRILAPLADLGGAIRDEIAVSLAPMAQELETALERASTLELRVRDLEARLATAAVTLVGLPIPAAQPVVEESVLAVERTDAIAARPVIGAEARQRRPEPPGERRDRGEAGEHRRRDGDRKPLLRSGTFLHVVVSDRSSGRVQDEAAP